MASTHTDTESHTCQTPKDSCELSQADTHYILERRFLKPQTHEAILK